MALRSKREAERRGHGTSRSCFLSSFFVAPMFFLGFRVAPRLLRLFTSTVLTVHCSAPAWSVVTATVDMGGGEGGGHEAGLTPCLFLACCCLVHPWAPRRGSMHEPPCSARRRTTPCSITTRTPISNWQLGCCLAKRPAGAARVRRDGPAQDRPPPTPSSRDRVVSGNGPFPWGS